MGDYRHLLVLDALRNVCALAIHNIKLPKERLAVQFLTYPTPEFNVGDKVLAQNNV